MLRLRQNRNILKEALKNQAFKTDMIIIEKSSQLVVEL